jgi:hypothetical protein
VGFGVSSERVRLIQHAGKRNNSWPAGGVHGDRAGACTSEASLRRGIGAEYASFGGGLLGSLFCMRRQIFSALRPSLVRRIDQRVAFAFFETCSKFIVMALHAIKLTISPKKV